MAHKSIAVGAAVALAGAVVLRRLGVEPVPTVFYLLAWYPTLLLLDALVAWKGGPSLWDQPRDTAAMLGWSVVIWCGFETLNLRLRDWYYVFAPAIPWQRWAGIDQAARDRDHVRSRIHKGKCVRGIGDPTRGHDGDSVPEDRPHRADRCDGRG